MKAAERKSLYQAVFHTDLGIKVLEDLKKKTGYRNTGFNADSDRLTSYNLGQKETLSYILKQLEAEENKNE